MKSLCLFLAALFSISLVAAEPLRPNILYFYVDDMGWGSIGLNGQAERRAKGLPSVKTPNIDQLAAEGVNFTQSYGCTVCSPARSSQQTGFHQGHTFADRNDPNNAKKAIRAEDLTMGDALSEAGYVTGYWGKWGYGGSADQKDPVIENVQTLPTSHGYQHVLAELHHVRAHTFFQPTLWSAPANAGATGGLELVPNSKAKLVENETLPTNASNHLDPTYPATAYCDDSFSFAALEFVRAQARNYNATKQPFFGLLAAQIPHGPFDEVAKLPDWNAAYADDPHFEKLAPQSQQWAAMVTRIDAHFGSILAVLEDPNSDGKTDDSIVKDTLVIFMSDNGGPGGKNNSELDANGGLRGNKGSIYEGGIRVPTVMRWPGRVAAGTENDSPIDVSDLLPTFCELAGVDIPLGLDGVSLAPTLTGIGEQRKRDFLIHEAGKAQSIIRGTDKLVRMPKMAALYDLNADPAESNNLAKGNGKLVKELEALLLGERVDEPRGFANTYHHWTGADGASASDADQWSDYIYQNAGTTYTEDKGAPQLSWTASMSNTTARPVRAKGDADLEFLGLEIGGGESTLELILDSKISLSGRNEIRLSPNGKLTVNGGVVSSLRWVEVKKGAVIEGSGKIDAILYNAGSVTVAARESPSTGVMYVSRDYREKPGSLLALPVSQEETSFQIEGIATLRGDLEIRIDERTKPQTGEPITILKAESVVGRFSNARDEAIATDGARFKIIYSANAVAVERILRSDPKSS